MSSEMSDERHEVARRLREHPVHLALGGEGGSPPRALAMLSELLDATGLRRDEPARLYGRLADLIDPTTEFERCHDHVALFYRCSKCGGLTVLWQPGSRQTKFCPSCGRRVVDGGEGHE